MTLFTQLLLCLLLLNGPSPHPSEVVDCDLECPDDDTIFYADENNQYVVPDFEAIGFLEITGAECAQGTLTQFPPPGTVIGLGITEVEIEITGINDEEDCQFDITIVPDPGSTCNWDCPDLPTVAANEEGVYILPDYIGSALVDTTNCEEYTFSQVPAPGTAISPPGTTIYFTRATENGSSTCGVLLTVTGEAPPCTLSCPDTIVTVYADEFGDYFVPYLDMEGIIAFDGCNPLFYDQNPVWETYFDFTGFISVEVSATVDGETFSCTVDLFVENPNAPPCTVTGPDTLTVTVEAGESFPLPDLLEAEIAQPSNCNDVGFVQSPEADTPLFPGSTVVSLGFSDDDLQYSVVYVVQTEAPPCALSGPDTLTVFVDNGNSHLLPDLRDVEIVESFNCGDTELVQLPEPGTALFPGITQVSIGTSGNAAPLFELTYVVETSSASTNPWAIAEPLRITPNPATGWVQLDLPVSTKIDQSRFYDSLGQLVHSGTDRRIDVRGWAPGVYLVQVLTTEGYRTGSLLVQ